MKRGKNLGSASVKARLHLESDVAGEQTLLGGGEPDLSLIHEVEGLGNVVADAVAFEAKAGAFAQRIQGTPSHEHSTGLPCLKWGRCAIKIWCFGTE